MAIARVGTSHPAGTWATSTASLACSAFSATTGNLIVVFVRSYSGNTISSVTDTAGNTYTLRASETGIADPQMFVYTAENILGHASNVVTVTLSGSQGFWWMCAVQYSGAATTSSTDTTEGKTGTGVTDLVSDAFNTSTAGVVVLGVSQGAVTTYTAGTDFTLVDGAISGEGNAFGGIEERITTGALSSYVAHITSGDSSGYSLLAIAIKEAAGGGGRTTKNTRSNPLGVHVGTGWRVSIG